MARGMSPRKQMAMGTSSSNMGALASHTSTNNDNEFSIDKGATGDFGVSPIPGGVKPLEHIDAGRGGVHLDDEARAAPPPINNGAKRLANQANPHHGPHHSSVGLHPGGSVMGPARPPRINPKAFGTSY